MVTILLECVGSIAPETVMESSMVISDDDVEQEILLEIFDKVKDFD